MKRQTPSEGKYQVFDARSPLALLAGTAPTVADLPQTHVFVRALQATDLEDVYWAMQGENWSPRGEARPLIEMLDLTHTSMSVGDVLRDEDGVYWECLDTSTTLSAGLGWRRVEGDTAEATLEEAADVLHEKAAR